MQKRGQLFIVAALIVAGALYGLTTTVNSVYTSPPNTAFYDLSKEIDFESKKVIDFGVYNERDRNELLRGFLEKYAELIGQDQALFIYGDQAQVHGIYFEASGGGSVGISTGSQPVSTTTAFTLNTLPVTQGIVQHAGDLVSIDMSGIVYDFTLREGENFFLILIQERNNEFFAASQY